MKENVSFLEVDEAIKDYYMTYSMKTIVDRALPDVRDGLKPVARRILYQMYKNKFTHDKKYEKTGTIVSEVMKIHPHGNASVSDAIAKMTNKNQSLLHPYIDGQGAFGKIYNTDNPSADRYTFARLEEFSNTMFDGLDKESVLLIGEDNQHLQPIALPTMFPNILVKPNSGMAVGQKTDLCSFNLKEICDLTRAYILDKNINVIDYLTAPDLSTGGQLLYDKQGLEKLYKTGLGNFKLRAKYRFEKEVNIIDVYEIPYTTTANKVISEITDLMKNKKIKDVTDIRDESGYDIELDRDILSIAIDVKRNTDVDKLMLELFSKTSLEDTYSCRFGVLVDYQPKTLGITQMLDEWLKFRRETLLNIVKYDINAKNKDLGKLYSIRKIMMDIDKTIMIIKSNNEKKAIELLMEEFDLTSEQGAYISDLKLKFLSKDNLEKQIIKIEQLEFEVKQLRLLQDNPSLLDNIICSQLTNIVEKYGQERKTEIVTDYKVFNKTKENTIPNYNVVHIYSEEGYYKKIPLTSYSRTTADNKMKEGDYVKVLQEGANHDVLLAFTDKGNIYRINASDIDDSKLTDFGQYLYNVLDLKEERIVNLIITDYSDKEEFVLLSYKKGYSAKIPLINYKSNYSCLKGNTKDELIDVYKTNKDVEMLVISEKGMCLQYNSEQISLVNAKSAKGVVCIGLNKGDNLKSVIILENLNPTKLIFKDEYDSVSTMDITPEDYIGKRNNKGKRVDYNFNQVIKNIRKGDS